MIISIHLIFWRRFSDWILEIQFYVADEFIDTFRKCGNIIVIPAYGIHMMGVTILESFISLVF